jgi:heme-degrading monooxygenase HmoA
MAGASYVTLWAFSVEPSKQAEFEAHYGADGSWAQLFGRADGYLGTELLRDRADATRYLTVDRWQSAEAWRAFRDRFAAEYERLDRECAALTTLESPLGEYEDAAGRAR